MSKHSDCTGRSSAHTQTTVTDPIGQLCMSFAQLGSSKQISTLSPLQTVNNNIHVIQARKKTTIWIEIANEVDHQ